MLKNSSYFLFMCIFCLFNFACAQKGFMIKETPHKYKTNVGPDIYEIPSDFVDLTSYLPKGFSKNGNVDYTEYLQTGLDNNRKVIFPDFPIMVNDKGLSISSNSELYFGENSVVKLKASDKGNYEILRLHNVSDIKIYNPVIIGDRKIHKGSTGEWGMGISIRASSNISIYNPIIEDCWGDGIYLGHNKLIAPENVTIENPQINNSRRNGISITTGKNITVNHALVSNTNGTKPECGIVIEPSNSSAVFENIRLNDPVTYNNKEAGIQIGGFEKLLGVSQSEHQIVVNNHLDDRSNRGVFIGRIRSADIVEGPNLKGTLVIRNPRWINNRLEPFVFRRQNKRGPKILLEDISEEFRAEIINNSDIDIY